MRTPASIAGHPIHPMIVPLAIGGFILSFIFDICGIASGNADPWASIAYYTMIGGIVGALLAAVFGLMDLLSIPAGHAKKIGVTHMIINLAVVGLFICNAWLRHEAPGVGGTPFFLSLIGVALLAVSGWLGGKLVFEEGIGVSGGEQPVARPNTNRPREA